MTSHLESAQSETGLGQNASELETGASGYLEAEAETGVGQQVDAALHHVLGDAEVGEELGLHVGPVEIFSVLALAGRRNLCRERSLCDVTKGSGSRQRAEGNQT